MMLPAGPGAAAGNHDSHGLEPGPKLTGVKFEQIPELSRDERA